MGCFSLFCCSGVPPCLFLLSHTHRHIIVWTGFVSDHQGWREAFSHPHYLTLKFVQPLLTGFPLVSPFSLTTSTSLFSLLLTGMQSFLTKPTVKLPPLTSTSSFCLSHTTFRSWCNFFKKLPLPNICVHPESCERKHMSINEKPNSICKYVTCGITEAYQCCADWQFDPEGGWHRTFQLAIQCSVTLTVQTRPLCCPSTQTQAWPLLCCCCTKPGLLKQSSHAPVTPG